MLPEVVFLQTVFVDGIHDLPKEDPKSLGDEGEFFVERVLQDLLVDVAYEVDKAFLLLTRHAVVSGVKVAHQHSIEPCQHPVQNRCFA